MTLNTDPHLSLTAQQPTALTRFAPRVTVASLVERDGKLLMVQERTSDGVRINQPAGHLDEGETLLQAVVRETLEETAWQVQPRCVLGLYMSRYWSERTSEDVCYLRIAFVCDAIVDTGQPLDQEIMQAFWASPEDILARQPEHRSPLVMQCVHDWSALKSGQRAPIALEALFTDPSVLVTSQPA